ncbi:O-antigen ligase family protein [Amaricoccus macauensis]|uniref:O-antigen ligase family protein n=1 Tax=Amaricoccus macauensis TaxID=57001 RepID=UPI003C7CBAC7
MAIAIALLFLLQLALDLTGPLPETTRKLWAPALLFAVAAVWAITQIWPETIPAVAHPVWDLVPGGTPTISADPGQGRHFIMRLLCYGMAFWIAHRATADARRSLIFLRTFAIFSTALALYGLYALVTGHNPILGVEQAYPTLSASFVNRNSYATYAAFGALANLGLYLSASSRETGVTGETMRQIVRNGLEQFFSGTWLYAVGMVVCIGAVALTQSRAGAMSGLLGLGALMLAWRGQKRSGNLALVIGISALLVYVGWTSTTGLGARLMTSPTEDLRFVIYPELVSGIAERPWLGNGLGAFPDAFRANVPLEAARGEWVMAHNTYLENLYELGLPAGLALFASLGLVVWRIRKGTVERRRNRVFTCVVFGCIVTAAFHSLLDFSLQMPASAALFAFLLGMGWSQSFASSRRGRVRRSESRVPAEPA